MLLKYFDLSCLFRTVCQNMVVETCKHCKRLQKLAMTAAWLAQLVECQSVVREVEGSSLRPEQHSGS